MNPSPAAPVRIALPVGRLLCHTLRLLETLHIAAPVAPLRRTSCPQRTWTIHLLKVQDIPSLVADGAIDVAVAADEWILETGATVDITATLGWLPGRICLLAQAAARPADEPRVATPYPQIARRALAATHPHLHIRAIHGSAEAYPPDLADLVVDYVETGAAAATHHLQTIQTLHTCGVSVITSPGAAPHVTEAARQLHTAA
ncbi:MAG: ATP phosphoribosyltransferase [Solirubrobacteraceae bacterium]